MGGGNKGAGAASESQRKLLSAHGFVDVAGAASGRNELLESARAEAALLGAFTSDSDSGVAFSSGAEVE